MSLVVYVFLWPGCTGHYNIILNAFLHRGSGMSLCCSSGTDSQVWECLLALSEFRTNSINHIWTSSAVPTSISNRFSEVKTLRIWVGRWKTAEVSRSQSSQLLQTSPDRVLPNFLFKKKRKKKIGEEKGLFYYKALTASLSGLTANR